MKKNRLPLFLALLMLLILAGLAGIITYLKWQSDLMFEQTERILGELSEEENLVRTILESDTYTAQELAALTPEELSDLIAELSTISLEPLTENAGPGIPGFSTGSHAGEAETGSPSYEQISEHAYGSQGIEALSESVSESAAESTGSQAAGQAGSIASSAYFTDEELRRVRRSIHHVIFVGDSRTVGMGEAEAKIGDGCVYIGEPGEGYSWLVEFGIEQMDEAIRAYPNSPVVFNFGVNDCDAVHAYIELYHEIERGYPDTKFYYMSVNPVTEESLNVPLTDVLAFNRVMKSAFPDQYIDTCTWMIRGGFEDVDGVHYSRDQYRKIHDYAVLSIQKLKSAGGSQEPPDQKDSQEP